MKKLSEIIIRDPFILACRQNGTYYMYGTTGSSIGFHCYESRDLENWTGPYPVFIPDSSFWGTRDFWAAEVHFYNDKYYMFASCKAEDRCRATHIFCADSPRGPFVPVSEKPATPEDWECLDGTLYVDEAGVPYLVFCPRICPCFTLRNAPEIFTLDMTW